VEGVAQLVRHERSSPLQSINGCARRRLVRPRSPESFDGACLVACQPQLHLTIKLQRKDARELPPPHSHRPHCQQRERSAGKHERHD
jgi:hypothetical protein